VVSRITQRSVRDMNKRIQQALDGDIDMIRLSTSEREELRKAESNFEAVVRAIPVTPIPDVAPAVLARIRHEVCIPTHGGTSGPDFY
jgi:hypothetical protein